MAGTVTTIRAAVVTATVEKEELDLRFKGQALPRALPC